MSVELYLIRHGLAEERGEAWPDDGKRPLTDKGRKRLRQSARALSALGVSFEVILTSPLVRARQTADIVAAALEDRPLVVSTESLAPEGGFAALAAELEKHAKRDRVALVGHEPGIGALAARLIGSRQPIPFKKGAVCRIDVEALPPDGAGRLQWLLPPRLLRRLGK
jgi:phosphohistidine phosphatase